MNIGGQIRCRAVPARLVLLESLGGNGLDIAAAGAIEGAERRGLPLAYGLHGLGQVPWDGIRKAATHELK
jgi:hypothetical protein